MRICIVAALVCAALVGPALAQGSKVSSVVELARQAQNLKPGQWVWAPQVAPAGPIIVYVDLDRQLATVYRNGLRIGVSTISSGKAGHETPTGVFTILQKDKDHRSSTYDNASMPYQERLTWDGVALHAGGLPGYPESHGCIHLPYEFSKLLFGITQIGGTVVIAGRHGEPVTAREAGVLAPFGVGGAAEDRAPLSGGEAYRWTPEASPSGPVSIIISKADHRAVVLRNGVEIGRAHAEIEEDAVSTHVATLARGADGKAVWLRVGAPGHEEEAGQPVDPAAFEKIRAPKAFLDEVARVMTVGTTVLVTASPVGSDNSGTRLTVLSAVKGDQVTP
jgi:hypothetical protein